MGESIRETGRRRARLAATAVGASGLMAAAAVAAAVYTPAAAQNVSTTDSTQNSGTYGSDNSQLGPSSGYESGHRSRGNQYQGNQYQGSQQQGSQQGVGPSLGGGPMGHSSGS